MSRVHPAAPAIGGVLPFAGGVVGAIDASVSAALAGAAFVYLSEWLAEASDIVLTHKGAIQVPPGAEVSAANPATDGRKRPASARSGLFECDQHETH
jgi:hypothetical protein